MRGSSRVNGSVALLGVENSIDCSSILNWLVTNKYFPVAAVHVVALHPVRVLPVEEPAGHYDLPLILAQNWGIRIVFGSDHFPGHNGN